VFFSQKRRTTSYIRPFTGHIEHAYNAASLIVFSQMSILQDYRAVILDMNSTFMFNEDRFSAREDFAATYREIGGSRLKGGEVNRAIRNCYGKMCLDYQNPEKYGNFPQIRDVLLSHCHIDYTSEEDIALLEKVFALHELGTIPEQYACHLKRLADSHELGLIANIWARKDLWLEEFARVGIHSLFTKMIFSSDTTSIKPSQVLFDMALEAFAADRSQILFVGDSLKYDMEGAKAAGLSTAWINSEYHSAGRRHVLADHIIDDLLHLE